ncbi:MAG: hypothetical protein A2X46_18520 [Lentisphaerae bacterium GWF2_57_35]|nr:MAG: hypothetical protein A2X46_18520 [Lentisphaerae bacterium GWF2_57_35]
MLTCRACASHTVVDLIDYGPQPLCNRFLAGPNGPEARFSLHLCLCPSCGVIQLAEVAPADELRPRLEWVKYNEAEGHLDDKVENILRITHLGTDAVVAGMSYKDASTVRRFAAKGFSKSYVIDLPNDLGVTAPGAGVESVQAALTEAKAHAIANRRGRPDLVIARHIIEHAHDMPGFARALRALVKPGGFVAFEVPDMLPSLENRDYSTIWEEHPIYFTPPTYRQTLERLGFRVLGLLNYPYTIENALVAITQVAEPQISPLPPEALQLEIQRSQAFAEAFPGLKARLQQTLRSFRQNEGSIAVFGASHLACKFINLMGIAESIDFVVDDDPNKNGFHMPGSRLPILGSSALIERQIRLCLLSLNPESEAKVIGKQQKYLEAGGTFASIFPANPKHLKF